jgi:hypothetical protein
MEQRREARFQADQRVMVEVLSDSLPRMAATVKDASGRGLGLSAPVPIPPGAAIRIEIEDAVVLGEAIYCRKDQDSYFVGIELDQVLVGLTELGRRLAAWMEPAERSASFARADPPRA